MANRFPLIFNSGAGQIQELAASDNLDLTSSNLVNAGILFTSSGSQTAPSISIGNGTTYPPGLYSPGADQLAVATNGTGRLFIDASGNFGFGITANAYGNNSRLTLQGSGLNNTIYSNFNGGGDDKHIVLTNGVSANAYVGTNDTSLTFGTGGTERLRITSTGTLNFKGAGTAGSTQAVSFNGSAPVDSMVLDSSGRLGIGTSLPSGPIHVTASSNGFISHTFSNTSNGSSAVNRIQIGNDASDGVGQIVVYGSQHTTLANTLDVTNAVNAPIRLLTNNTERVHITGAGLVGIGTSSPNAKLAFGESSSIAFNTSIGSTGTYGEIKAFNALVPSVSATNIRFIRDVAVDGNDGAICLDTKNIERLRVDSSGRLGIGSTTPSAKLVCDGHVQITNAAPPTTGAGLELSYGQINASRTAQQSYNRTGSAYLGSDYDALDYRWYISGSQKATIDSSGRLLVGMSTSTSIATRESALQLSSVDFAPNVISALNTRADQYGPGIALAKSRGGGSPVVLSGDDLGTIIFAGHDGTDLNSAGAYISAAVDGAVANDDLPTRLVFSTNPGSPATGPTPRMRIPSGGGLCVGSTVNPNALTQTSGIRLGSSTIASYDFTDITTSPVTVANGVGIGGLAFVQAYNTSTGAQYTGLIMWRSGVTVVISESNALGFGLTYSVSGSTLRLQTASGTITGSVITLAS